MSHILTKYSISPFNISILNESEFHTSQAFSTLTALDYIPHEIVTKIIIRKPTGNISVVSFDSGVSLGRKTCPFDTFIQIIDGNAEIIIDKQCNLLETGQFIIIPAHAYNTIKSNVRFKMLCTVIKSGYEDIIPSSVMSRV